MTEVPPPEPPIETVRTAPAKSDVAPDAPPAKRVVIKKYANRRLYNTASSSYVTLEHLSELVKQGVDFVVYDAKTNEDITRPVLTQIIVEEESRGENLLPIQFLRQLIRLYGASMQSFVPSYLEMSLDAFTRRQDRPGEPWAQMFSPAQAYPAFEEQVRQNMALFERTMKMFTPFPLPRTDEAHHTAAPAAGTGPAPPPGPPPAADASAESLAELKRRIEDMQGQIEKLASKG